MPSRLDAVQVGTQGSQPSAASFEGYPQITNRADHNAGTSPLYVSSIVVLVLTLGSIGG
jgi:hypothetical protein